MTKNGNRIFLSAFLAVCLFATLGIGCTTKSDSSSVLQQIGGVDDGTSVITYSQPAQNISQAVKYFADKDYDKAISAFQKALVTNPNQQEMSIAYSGIGWSKVKKSGSISDGKNDFESGYAARSSVQDAKVGLAAAYLLEDSPKIVEAVSLLESMGISDTGDVTVVNANFRYVSEVGTGISNASVHALLATLYYYNNQDALSKQQLAIAKQEDPSNDRVTSIDTAITTLGF
ncbi:MAG TPA: tetratricopeptide repeat protein [Candidatus Wallbacteria bacterium]|nr:tetratricopeptide repeat protein [Candidatus Wallbacteria bacterium]